MYRRSPVQLSLLLIALVLLSIPSPRAQEARWRDEEVDPARSRPLPDGTFKDSGDEERRTIEYY